jgi:DNA-binding transcriptional LysR family regulator
MNHLEVFMKVAEKMNMTEASKALFISQPAVSKALIQFENTLQVKLFIRDKQNGLVLTEVGKEMLSLARQMKEIEDKMVQLACQENKLLRGKVKIGSFPAASTNLLPEAICLFRSQSPMSPLN